MGTDIQLFVVATLPQEESAYDQQFITECHVSRNYKLFSMMGLSGRGYKNVFAARGLPDDCPINVRVDYGGSLSNYNPSWLTYEEMEIIKKEYTNTEDFHTIDGFHRTIRYMGQLKFWEYEAKAIFYFSR